MVVVLGFGFVHGGEREVEREKERERQEEEKQKLERGDIFFWAIYFIMQIYYFNVLYRNIKVRMLGML